MVASSPACAPLKTAYELAVSRQPKSWAEVEDIFLRGMEGFDANVASGIANQGDRQNGKGDFFNDFLALLLENCAGTPLYSRSGVPGLVFPTHHLDVTFPREGAIEFILEAKAVGTPKHPRSPRARAVGRAGSADLDKRIKEIGFKAIDLKAEFARIMAERGESPSVISGDLTGWLRSVKPRSFVFFAARVINQKDRDRVIRFADVAGLVSDAVGLFCFGPGSLSEPTRYRTEPVPSHVEIRRVLFRACQELTRIKDKRPVQPASPSPAEVAEGGPEGQP